MALSISPAPLFGPINLPTGATVLYTAPSAPTGVVLTKVVAANVGSNPSNIAINVVRKGGTAGTSNLVIPADLVAVGATLILSELTALVLQPGDFIVATPTVAMALNLVGSGYTYTLS